jgi:hypothetical protein
MKVVSKVRGWLSGKKTYIVAAVAVAYALVVVGWQGGDWGHAQEIVLAALGGSALRAGVGK